MNSNSHDDKSFLIPAPPAVHHSHRGDEIKVGPYSVLLGGTMYLQAEDLRKADVLIPLTEVPFAFGTIVTVSGDDPRINRMPPLEPGRQYLVLAAPLVDFGGVPAGWGRFLRKEVVPFLESGKKVMGFCMGSHGRTGTFLASLIAILEPETSDPIAAARERHCEKAVETLEQAKAVYALRRRKLPMYWQRQFHR